MRSDSRTHCRADAVHLGHIHTDIGFPPALNEGPQLILNILTCLSGEPWDGKVAVISAARRAVALGAILYFSPNFIRAARPGECDCQNGG